MMVKRGNSGEDKRKERGTESMGQNEREKYYKDIQRKEKYGKEGSCNGEGMSV